MFYSAIHSEHTIHEERHVFSMTRVMQCKCEGLLFWNPIKRGSLEQQGNYPFPGAETVAASQLQKPRFHSVLILQKRYTLSRSLFLWSSVADTFLSCDYGEKPVSGVEMVSCLLGREGRFAASALSFCCWIKCALTVNLFLCVLLDLEE